MKSEEGHRPKALEQENRELRRANETLCKAAALNPSPFLPCYGLIRDSNVARCLEAGVPRVQHRASAALSRFAVGVLGVRRPCGVASTGARGWLNQCLHFPLPQLKSGQAISRGSRQVSKTTPNCQSVVAPRQKTRHSVPSVSALLLLSFATFLLCGASTFNLGHAATQADLQLGKALPGAPCRIGKEHYPDDWTKIEERTWKIICEGGPANFNKCLSDPLDPKRPNHDCRWREKNRILSRDFLKVILFHEPFRSAIPVQGVIISGAHFDKGIDLNDGVIERPLKLDRALFGGSVELKRLHATKQVYLADSHFTAGLFMPFSSFGSLVSIYNSDVSGRLDMTSAKISGDLDMQYVNLKGHHYQDDGLLVMNRISVDGELAMHGGTFREVDLRLAEIDQILDLSCANFIKLDLSGTTVGGELRLWQAQHACSTTWIGDVRREDDDREGAPARLLLQNTTVALLQDSQSAWPSALELDGFSYDGFGGFEQNQSERPYDRPIGWFVDWLGRDTTYSAQPFQHLAGLFKQAGRNDIADKLLVASREGERGEYTARQFRWWFLSGLRIFVGYGYGFGYFLALAWVFVMSIIGTTFLYISKEWKEADNEWVADGEGPKWLELWFYSVDMLLPVIRLYDGHYRIDLATWVRYYFGIHKIVGYVLVFFIVVGLTNLTE